MANRFGYLATALAFVACNNPGVNSQEQRLAASPTAHSFGVDHYVIGTDAAKIFDENGVELGQITVSVPTADSRMVSVRLADANGLDNELTRPVDGRFQVALPVEYIQMAVEVDPALAPFFAQWQIEMTERPTSARKLQGVNPSELASCLLANSPCYDINQPGYYCNYSESWDTMSWCGDVYNQCTGCGPGQGQWSNGWDTYCVGGNHYTQYTNYVSCPTVHGCSYRDLVERTRYCTDPGSCSNNSPFIQCTSY